MTDTAEAQMRAAWLALANHGFECPTAPTCSRTRNDSDCPTEWGLYREWKRLWIEAGRPLGPLAEVSA